MLHAVLSVIWTVLPVASFHAAPLHQFKSEPLQANVRRFWHNAEQAFDDGSKVSLAWTLHADPDTILSFDEERRKVEGIAIAACSGDTITLRVPRGRFSEVDRWQSVVASHWAHECAHLAGDDIYARVTKKEIKAVDVVLHVQHVDSHADLVPFMSFEYEYTPSGESSRRLQEDASPVSTQNTETVDMGVHADDPTNINGFGASVPGIPLAMKQFGWNWNYQSNRVEHKEFNYKIPGAEGYLKLFDPYVKANASIKVWYSSSFVDIQKPPHVQLTVAIDGSANIHGKMVSMFDSDKDTIASPEQYYDVPILHELAQPVFFGDVNFTVGNIPIRFNPGVQMQARAYHVGKFKGTMQVGIDSDVEFAPVLSFDSLKGVDTQMTAKLLNVKLFPPTWLIFTKHFESGVVLEANIWIKGRVGGMKDAEVGMGVKPYLNLTIARPGVETVGAVPTSTLKTLLIYPFRASGLPKGKSYAIKIGANGMYRTTSSQMSYGIIDYSDHASNFAFGGIEREALMADVLEIQLLEDGKEPAVASLKTVCGMISDTEGVCKPQGESPARVQLKLGDSTVTIEMVIVWRDNILAKEYIVNDIYGLSFGFPTITLTEDMSAQMADGGGFFGGGELPFTARIIRDGQSYTAPMTLDKSDPKAFFLATDTMAELGTSYLPMWTNFPGTPPSIHILHGDDVVASQQLPEIAGLTRSQNIELDMSNPDDFSQIVGTGSINVTLWSPKRSSFFIYPYQFTHLELGVTKGLYWAAAGILPGEQITFTVEALKVTGTDYTNPQFVVVDKATKKLKEVCSAIAMPGGYDTYTNDCLFGADFEFKKETGFLGGDKVIIRLKWDADGWTHEMKSPPILIAAAGPVSLYEMVTPRQGEILHRGLPTRNLDVSWSSFDSDHEQDDIEHCRLHGLGDESSCGRSNLHHKANAMSLSITKKDTATEVYHKADIDPKSMFHRVPGSVVKRWQDGEYDVKLSWDNAAELRRSVKISSGPRTSSSSWSTEASRQLQFWSSGDEETTTTAPGIDSGHWSANEVDWNKRMSEFNPNCAEEPLKYGLGSGVLVRGTVKNVHVPKNFPVIGGVLASPDYNSGYKPIIVGKVDNSLSSLLPPMICSGGLCEGELPGCPPPAFSEVDIPMVSFQFSRPFLWSPNTPESLKNYIAYGFSILPAAIKAHIVRLNVTLPNSITRTGRLLTEGDTFTSFAVTFNEALPYKVDKQLVQALLHNGAFDLITDGHEDKLGKISIVGFDVEGNSIPLLSDGKSTQYTSEMWPYLGTILIAGAVFGLAVIHWQRKPPLEQCRPDARRRHLPLASNDPGSDDDEVPRFVERAAEEQA